MNRDQATTSAGRRVLFLPHNLRTPFFTGLLAHIRDHTDWEVWVVCEPALKKVYEPFLRDQEHFAFVAHFGIRQPWEGDPRQVARMDELIASCERQSGVSMGRILLAGERDVGRAFSLGMWDWSINSLARQVLKNPDISRRIIARMFHFADQVLTDLSPSFLLTGSANPPIAQAFSLVARNRGIPVIIGRWSKVVGNHSYWTRDPFMFNQSARQVCARKQAANAPVSPRAQEIIATMRQRPTANAFIASNWKNKEKNRSFLQHHLNCFHLALGKIAWLLKGRVGPPPRPLVGKLLEYYIGHWRDWRQNGFFKRYQPEELSALRYLYYPMHQEPEQNVNFQAYPFQHQFALIRFLAAHLPHGMRLLVREHRGNRGRRFNRYYWEMTRLPGVDLIDPMDDQFKYILHADLIITDNGSSGFEGLIFGKPVITLAPTFYDAARLAVPVRDPFSLNRVLLDILSSPPDPNREERERNLGWLIDAELETTVNNDQATYPGSIVMIEALLAEASS